MYALFALDEMITLMRADLERIPKFFQHVKLMWSEMILWVVWQGERDGEAVDRARRNINARLARFIRSREWIVVRHRLLEGDNRRFMRPDGVHLKENGLEIFLSGLQSGIEHCFC